MNIHRSIAFDRFTSGGEREEINRPVAVECPIALEFNGIGYAVMMATPTDLADFALGFALSERLVSGASDVLDTQIHHAERGILVRTQIKLARQAALEERVRHRVTESSCGLCGIENLEQILRPLPRVDAESRASDESIFRALCLLAREQPGNRKTGAMHAAALCDFDGTPILIREDIGRHNAFDKLIGGIANASLAWNGGFALLTSRCSYELVEKAALAGCPLLVTMSAPTSLAIERAEEAGVRLVALARPDSALEACIGL